MAESSPWKDDKQITPDIRAIYRAETAEAAAARLDEFEAKWGTQYPVIAPSSRRACELVVPMSLSRLKSGR